ncbi:hypothetical protein EDB81DRAFT_758624 [Dactylonectria macrodidyma]|uniref:Uncharacterized protein n=1 Tax=Dactylonectria macrodidyma TaxID=307937 RepID=A0A9P9J7C3_9HYPO|nr:hypothetical protein EDB81DRAFT_758624 [Dactylonectria macrodidyma]
MTAFMIASISGIAFTISFLSQNLTLSRIGIPALLYRTSSIHSTGKEQASDLAHQWQKIYDRGHIMGPGAALMSTSSFIYALKKTESLSDNLSDNHKVLLITAASLPTMIFPYTYLLMDGINQELFWRAGTRKKSPSGPNASAKLSTTELVQKWGYYNLVRAFIPALGGLCGAIVLCA